MEIGNRMTLKGMMTITRGANFQHEFTSFRKTVNHIPIAIGTVRTHRKHIGIKTYAKTMFL